MPPYFLKNHFQILRFTLYFSTAKWTAELEGHFLPRFQKWPPHTSKLKVSWTLQVLTEWPPHTSKWQWMTTRTRKRVKFNFPFSEGPEAPNAYEGAGRALSTRTYIDNWRVLRWFHIHSSTFKTCLKNLWKSAKPTDFRRFRRGQLLDPPICTMWVSKIWSNLLNLALLKLIKTDQN